MSEPARTGPAILSKPSSPGECAGPNESSARCSLLSLSLRSFQKAIVPLKGPSATTVVFAAAAAPSVYFWLLKFPRESQLCEIMHSLTGLYFSMWEKDRGRGAGIETSLKTVLPFLWLWQIFLGARLAASSVSQILSRL